MQPGEEIVYRVARFQPGVDSRPRVEEFRIPYAAGMTVLDGLWKIKETQAPSLSWRVSCRMGICGSCGMFVNGRARLACNTQISELDTPVVDVRPLPNFDIIRDLVPDLQPMFDRHTALSPYLIRDDVEEQERPTIEYRQTQHELERYLQFSYCIKCGCCMAACPTTATDPVYSGPMPLSQAHRYNADSRDEGFGKRLPALAGESGPWRCHYAGECSRVCPKGVDPARAIQLLRRQMVFDYLHLRRPRRPAPLVERPARVERRPEIPEAPPRTIRAAEPQAPSGAAGEDPARR